MLVTARREQAIHPFVIERLRILWRRAAEKAVLFRYAESILCPVTDSALVIK
jgi:hypothetical protein